MNPVADLSSAARWHSSEADVRERDPKSVEVALSYSKQHESTDAGDEKSTMKRWRLC